jgi:GTP pyrophosphokinase
LGITFRGHGVVVHAVDCAALADYEEQPERWLDLHWQDGNHSAVNTVTFDATIANDAGVLGRICTLIGEQNANISDLRFIDRKPDYFKLLIDVDLRDAEHMHRIRTALEAESNVSSISRHRDPGLSVLGAGTPRKEG